MKLKFSLPQLNKKKFVFIVGEEGAILVYMEGYKVLRRLYARSTNPNESKAFENCLSQDTTADIYLLADIMDQSYSHQNFPPVGIFNMRSLLKRRLHGDFPEEEIKGYRMLGRQKEGRKDWRFLFVAVSSTPQLMSWLDYIGKLPNRFKGVYTVPIESEKMVRSLRKVLLPKKTPDPKWELLVSHHKLGGFRQVVLKEGQLVFTRLSQPVGEMTPEVIAGNIEQEVINTAEYLRRLGYREKEDNFNLYVIASQPIKEQIDIKNNKFTNSFLLTPFELSQKLLIRDAAQSQDHFGDVVIAAFFGKYASGLLKLNTVLNSKIELLCNIGNFVRLVGGVLVPFLLAFSVYLYSQMGTLRKDINFAENQRTQAISALDQISSSKSDLPQDMQRITDVTGIYDLLSDGQKSPLQMLASFSKAMTENIRLKGLTWMEQNNQIKPNKTETDQSKIEMKIALEMLNQSSDFELVIKNANELLVNARKQLPDYKIEFTRAPAGIDNRNTITAGFNEQQTGPATVDVDMMVSGPEIKPVEQGNNQPTPTP